jgi:ferrochelatase
MGFDSVLMIGFGGPTEAVEIRPYLENVVRGRNVPPERLEEVAHHYEAIGGYSPYNEITFRQAEALRARMGSSGCPLPVYVGMRNWHPFLRETIGIMNRAGVRRSIGVIMAPHRSPTSWERYQLDVQRAAEENGRGPEVEYLETWHQHPLFLEAMAQRVEEASGYRRGNWPAEVPLVFTTHSIPESMARACCYTEETCDSGRGIAEILKVRNWSVAYQSRSGDARTPWLEPDVNEVIREAASDGVREMVLAPVGFLCDHVEVLFDLDVEAKETAEEVGVMLRRAGTVGEHPCFIQMLAESVMDKAGVKGQVGTDE